MASVRRGFLDMLLEDVNQTEQSEGCDATSKPDWLPLKVRMNSMLWAGWEPYREGRMQASLRIHMWTPKHLITCVCRQLKGPPWLVWKKKQHKNGLDALLCQLSGLKCSKFRNFCWRKATVWGDQAWKNWWWGRKISVFLHYFYHFFLPMERAKGNINSKEDFLILSDWAMLVKDRK